MTIMITTNSSKRAVIFPAQPQECRNETHKEATTRRPLKLKRQAVFFTVFKTTTASSCTVVRAVPVKGPIP